MDPTFATLMCGLSIIPLVKELVWKSGIVVYLVLELSQAMDMGLKNFLIVGVPVVVYAAVGRGQVCEAGKVLFLGLNCLFLERFNEPPDVHEVDVDADRLEGEPIDRLPQVLEGKVVWLIVLSRSLYTCRPHWCDASVEYEYQNPEEFCGA
jgi:hypothetical protein